MNGYVHYTLTRRWAQQAGFTADEAEILARFDVRTDRGFSGTFVRYKRYHFSEYGARRLAAAYLARAIRERSIPHLGVALHCEQDSITHGPLGSLTHWRPGVDIWEKRSPRIRERLERVTKEWVEAYLDAELPEGISVPEPPPGTPLPPDLPWP